jgi:hypothetical protein
MFCPCWLGPKGEPDRGWCSGIFAFDIQSGDSDGVDLAGTKSMLVVDWPGNFFAGQGKGRVYVDNGADETQRRELEAIFGGQKEGFFSGLWGAVIDEWLPARAAQIDLGWDGAPSLAVDGLGHASLEPVTNGAGQETRISGAMAQAALHIESMQLAEIADSQWSDPGLRPWRAEDGVLYDFAWSS